MSHLKQVKASAGSGKTYQLTRRFLSLLERADEQDRPIVCTSRPHHGYAWPEIMAVTFTNKAAAEMKERVVAGLKQAALCPDGPKMTECSPQTASRAIDAILRRYHRLNIRTIDSLLALLLRLFALEFGIRPDFQMVFDETELFEAVYDHFLAICESDSPERALLADTVTTMLKTEERTGFWMQDMVRKRLLDLTRFLRGLDAPLMTDQDTIKDILVATNADFKRTVQASLEYFTDLDLPLNANFKKFTDKCMALSLFDTPPESKMIQKDSFRECVLKKGQDMVTDRVEAEYAALKQAYEAYIIDQTALSGAFFLAPAIGIALRLLNGLDELQRQRGIILGSSLAGFVNQQLNQNDAVSEAYCRMGCRLHHLLIDEFQDTSREQWRSVTPLSQECLAKGGSLYYVGDVKQAIYGWRGGDSALFDEIMTQPDVAELASDAESDTLPNNWRSFRNVVEFNNEFFGNFEDIENASAMADDLFRDAPDDFRASFASDLAANFTDCTQAVPDKNADSEGYVRMELLPGSNKDDIEQHAMEALDALMDELAERRKFRDIAILVRKHDHAELVCDLLVQKGIPVITENSLRLDRHPIVRQLVGLLGFLDFPRDDVAFLSFASGDELFLAESGLAQADFHDWLIQPRKKPLGVSFREDFPDHWQRFIEPFYNQSGLMTPYDLAREAVRAFRILERHPEAELYVRRFLEVVHLAEENGYGSLAAFLEYWSEKSGEEKVPLPENIDAVHIMTIHKSKGLEFPVVIVPFHNWGVSKDRDFHVHRHGTHRLLTPMKKGLGKPYQTSRGRAVREQLNLLYVAWTRAREELYGFFTEKPADSPALAAMNRFLDLGDDPVFKFGVQPESGAPSLREVQILPQDLPAQDENVDLTKWLMRLRVYRHNRDEYFYNSTMRGEVAHKTMEYLRITGDDAVDTDRAIRLAMQDFPALGGLDPAEFDQLGTDLRAMTAWILANDQLRKWIAEGEREPEVMTSENEFNRLDLLYRSRETVVADFKTGQPTPKNREQVLEYMHILEDAGYEKPKGYLIYLDLREVHPVMEDA